MQIQPSIIGLPVVLTTQWRSWARDTSLYLHDCCTLHAAYCHHRRSYYVNCPEYVRKRPAINRYLAFVRIYIDSACMTIPC